MRFGIVAGEASGDILGAGLIRSIKQLYPGAQFEGIAGPEMISAGAKSLFPMERLSVMGIVEVLGRYPELLAIRKRLTSHFRENPPDVFIGVDAPDFNLELERRLHKAGIKTVHYVSPSVWAWRQQRVKKIAASTDLMLTLFPFEAAFYQRYHIPVQFVGHPLADIIPLHVDQLEARRGFSLAADEEVLALLPGSRSNELHYLARPFIETARWLSQRRPGLRIIVPLANANCRHQFEQALARLEDVPDMLLVDGQSREVMAAANVVLLASGTAALEAMLLKRPMVVAYKLAPLSYSIMKRLVKVPNVSLPNNLAGRTLVPEFIQHEVIPEKMGQALLDYLQQPELMESIHKEFHQIHQELQLDASEQAAVAVLKLLGSGNGDA